MGGKQSTDVGVPNSKEMGGKQSTDVGVPNSKVMGGKQSTDVGVPNSKEYTKELRMLLVGKTGSGKSETGNSILLKTQEDDKAFKSQLCGESVTQKCTFGTNEVFGDKLVVVDTPGLFDTKKKNRDTLKELTKCVLLLRPGPHAIIIVLRIERQTAEIQETVQILLKLFKNEAYRHLIVLFTGKDSLIRSRVSLDSYLKTMRPDIKEVILKSSNRCIAFNNISTEEENENQVKELVDMVKSVVKQNGGGCYISDLQKRLNQTAPTGTGEDLNNPDCYREKVLEEDPTSSASWMWQAVVAVGRLFNFKI